MPTSFLLLLVLFTFSKCKKSSDFTNDLAAQSAKNALSATATVSQPITLSLVKAESDGGFAYKAYGINGSGDSVGRDSVSTMRLYENGKEIGPGHSLHANIRSVGKGLFSHWGTALYFSSSDNTDPRTNGRTYTYTLGTPANIGTSSSVASDSKIIGFAMEGGGGG